MDWKTVTTEIVKSGVINILIRSVYTMKKKLAR